MTQQVLISQMNFEYKAAELDPQDTLQDQAEQELMTMLPYEKARITDFPRKFHSLTPVVPTENSESIVNTSNVNRVGFKTPRSSKYNTYLLSKFMAFTFKLSYSSSTVSPSVGELEEGPLAPFYSLNIQWGDSDKNSITIPEAELLYINEKIKRALKDRSDSYARSLNLDTAAFLPDTEKIIMVPLDLVAKYSRVKTILNVPFSTTELSEMTFTFQLRKSSTELKKFYKVPEVISYTITSPRLLVWELEDAGQDSLTLKKMWDRVKNEPSFKTMGLITYSQEINSGTKSVKLKVPVPKGEQIKNIRICGYTQATYEGDNFTDKYSKVKNGYFKDLQIRDGPNGRYLFYGDHKLSTTELAEQYFMKMTMEGDYLREIKDTPFLNTVGKMDVSISSSLFQTLDTPIINDNSELHVNFIVMEDLNETALSSLTTFEVEVEYEREYSYTNDQAKNIQYFRELQ